MADGHLNKCIDCTKQSVEINRQSKLLDPAWVEKEAERQRQKERKRYLTKLKGNVDYNERISKNRKKWIEKYPYKRSAHIAAESLPCEKGLVKHHWSYNEKHWKDIIPLEPTRHFYVHRFLEFVEHLRIYKTKAGEILNTKQKHEDYISNLPF